MYKLKKSKILAMLLTLTLLFSMSACGDSENGNPEIPEPPETPDVQPPNETTEPDCVMIRQVMIDTTDLAAAAYLGYFDMGYDDLKSYLEDNGFLENHPFIADIPHANYIEHEGGELYCIVPADENAKVKVYEWVISEANDYMGEPGDLIYENHCGAPILLKGNMSEGMPNMMVQITDSEGNVLEYIPSVSMMDGTLTKPMTLPTIYDFTPYDALGYEYGFTVDHLTAFSNWITSAYTVNQENVEGSLYFGDSGEMEFCYAIHEGEPYSVYYEGIYYLAEGNVEEESIPDDAVIFELKLVADNSDLQIARPEILTAMTFEKDPSQNSIYMHYVAGDYLFDNEQYFDYLLEPAVG